MTSATAAVETVGKSKKGENNKHKDASAVTSLRVLIFISFRIIAQRFTPQEDKRSHTVHREGGITSALPITFQPPSLLYFKALLRPEMLITIMANMEFVR